MAACDRCDKVELFDAELVRDKWLADDGFSMVVGDVRPVSVLQNVGDHGWHVENWHGCHLVLCSDCKAELDTMTAFAEDECQKALRLKSNLTYGFYSDVEEHMRSINEQ